jgi:uncharacterized protein
MGTPRVRLAIVVYGGLTALAFVWAFARGDLDLYHHPEPMLDLGFPGSTALSAALGCLVGVAVVLLTRVFVRHMNWARRLHTEFRTVLGPLRSTEIGALALTSSVGEELFFRGAMAPAIGLIASSVIFGLVHMGPIRTFWPWTVWALIMGFVFGGMYELTGEILAPVIAHFVINYENLHFIDNFDPERIRRPSVGPRLAPPPERKLDDASDHSGLNETRRS